MRKKERDKIVISVGGSIIVPKQGIDTHFLQELNSFIREQLTKHPNRQFFLVIGGGSTSRFYRGAGRDVVMHELTNHDLDWLGIHATRLNGHLIRTLFQDIAHPVIIENYDIIRKVTEPIVVAAGWKPGWSTDYCATLLCEDYDIDTILNLSNVTQVYDRDPNAFTDAKPKKKMQWKDFRAIVGDTWQPGMHAPFDPIAAKKAETFGIKTVIMSGNDFVNIEKYFQGEPFLGTVIE